MANIIHTLTNAVQLNTPYNSNDELNAVGLTDWRISTDDEVISWQNTNAEAIKQINKDNILTQIQELELIGGIRSVREGLLFLDYVGSFTDKYPNGKIKDIDSQITILRNQL